MVHVLRCVGSKKDSARTHRAMNTLLAFYWGKVSGQKPPRMRSKKHFILRAAESH